MTEYHWGQEHDERKIRASLSLDLQLDDMKCGNVKSLSFNKFTKKKKKR